MIEPIVLNLELPNKKVLKLVETKSGDLIGAILDNYNGSLCEIVNFTIVKNHRDVLARFIQENP